MKKSIFFVLIGLLPIISFGQKFTSGACMSLGTQAKYESKIEISDTLFTITDAKTGNMVKYKVVSKSMNNNGYLLTDGVRDIVADIQFYEKPPVKVKGTAYHVWITLTINNTPFTYFAEKDM